MTGFGETFDLLSLLVVGQGVCHGYPQESWPVEMDKDGIPILKQNLKIYGQTKQIPGDLVLEWSHKIHLK